MKSCGNTVSKVNKFNVSKQNADPSKTSLVKQFSLSSIFQKQFRQGHFHFEVVEKLWELHASLSVFVLALDEKKNNIYK